MELAHYQVTEKIYDGRSTIIYRGLRKSDQLPVIIKVPREEFPSLRTLARYRNEYNILRSTQLEGVVSIIELLKLPNGWAIIEEDFGAQSLDSLLEKRRLGLLEFLRMAIKMAHGLAGIHNSGIIHKDLKPSNILINQETGEVKIGDFGLSTMIGRERQDIKSPTLLEGTLAFISPEQTGRMNRVVDYRTDLYSLGVTFYLMLSGSLPFTTVDALELVHCHLAKEPRPVHEIDGNIPEIISQIVRKLMAKTVENRYQSAYGLKYDLERCLEMLSTTGEVKPFLIGSRDISNKFEISQKLYGREIEVRELLTVFDRTSVGRTEMVLVNGYSGIGKSVLIHEIQKPIVARKGFFISGKFDQFQRGVPFSSLLSAFGQLVHQILAEGEEAVAKWASRIKTALGDNGQVLIDVVPALEYVIGPQPPVPTLGPGEARNRFHLVFGDFIGVFLSKHHPLVLFLDDLQWVDEGTLKLLEVLACDESSKYLLIIGAYRDNEVNTSHPLHVALEDIRKAGGKISEIHLNPLRLPDLNLLVSDTLALPVEETTSLAELLMDKTGGNPFFVIQLLRSLHERGLIVFEQDEGRWIWDANAVRSEGFTTNVVDLLIRKIKTLPDTTQNILKVASCIDAVFDLETLCLVLETKPEEALNDLWPALREGYLLTQGNHYKFLHDRVQQAAHTMIPERDQIKLHLRIGRLLLDNISEQELSSRIFEVVNHFNAAIFMLEDPIEKLRIARLNLVAGNKARESTAYTPALSYYNNGLSLLPDSYWSRDYAMMMGLTTGSAECKSLTGDFKGSEQAFELALEHSQSTLDTARIRQKQIRLCYYWSDYPKSVSLGVSAIALFGIDVPEDPAELARCNNENDARIVKTLMSLDGATLLAAPAIEDEMLKLRGSLLIDLWTSTYLTAQYDIQLLTLINLTDMTLKFGNSDCASFAYMVYGMRFGIIQGNYAKAFELGEIALELNRRYENPSYTGMLHNIYGHIISPYRRHLKYSVDIYRTSIRYLFQNGEIVWGVWALVYTIWARIMIGDNLSDVYENTRAFLDVIRKYNMDIVLKIMGMQQHVVLNLQGRTRTPETLTSDDFDEEKTLALFHELNFVIGITWYNILRAFVHYLRDDFERALQCSERAQQTIATCFGFFDQTKHFFYYSLSITALYEKYPERQAEFDALLAQHLDMFRHWQDNSPDTFCHQYQLLEAESARVKGDYLKAMRLYDQAFDNAKKQDFQHHAALARELAARMYTDLGQTRVAVIYTQEAHFAYLNWGAAGKVAQLQAKYAFLEQTETNRNAHLTSISTITDSDSTSLDLKSVYKISRAISGEIVLEKLLSQLMNYMLENAGAQRGLLILWRDGLRIEAEGSVEGGVSHVMEGRPLTNDLLPVTIIDTVQRSKTTLVLEDAANRGDFRADPYVVKHQLRSMLCMPIMHQGVLTAILYLENQLIAGAFTQERLNVLRLISSQVAISFENALLYKNLENKVTERTSELEQANLELSQTLENLKQAQTQLIQSEKMASLGQLVAGIAHEVNTPAGAIHAGIHEIDGVYASLLERLVHILSNLPAEHWQTYLDACRLVLAYGAREQSTKEVREMGRGVRSFLQAHNVEISRNQSKDLAMVGFAEDNLDMLVPMLRSQVRDEIFESLGQLGMSQIHVRDIKLAIGRIVELVKALKLYSRLDSETTSEIDLRQDLDNTLIILHNQLKRGVTVHREYKEIPVIHGQGEQLNQVWTNLIHNAVQAMEGAGELYLRLLPDADGGVMVEIEDTGPGIPKEIVAQIFEPYFTTKPKGQGTGLGLSIANQIVTKHKGTIQVESRPGKTCFRVILPLMIHDKD